MEQQAQKLMFALMRSAVSGAPLSYAEKEACSEETVGKALKLAARHDLGHLVAWGVKNNGIANTHGESYIFKAVYRYQQIKYEYEALCTALEEMEVQFLPLKGSVIRKLYPEPWMRTSCDIDILVHTEDLEAVSNMLTEKMKYKLDIAYSHDVAFYSPSGVHVEMHFDLIEEGVVNASSEVLKGVWERSAPKDGCTYWYEMPDELFYFYHVAHMAKHVLNGGCGIKPFIDLWILDGIDNVDTEKRNALLDRGGLLKFCEVARRLGNVWFGSVQHDAITVETEHYVLKGGVYGTTENQMSILRDKMGGRVKYALSLIFLPYDAIKYMYPILQKHRWLTPFMQIRRWFRIVFKGRIKDARRHLKENSNLSDEQVSGVRRFLGDVGLM